MPRANRRRKYRERRKNPLLKIKSQVLGDYDYLDKTLSEMDFFIKSKIESNSPLTPPEYKKLRKKFEQMDQKMNRFLGISFDSKIGQIHPHIKLLLIQIVNRIAWLKMSETSYKTKFNDPIISEILKYKEWTVDKMKKIVIRPKKTN
ncbi:MAG TPA: hypothetical protein VJG83_00835 [archaeon]|nr:hypothetical protein [archaeon]